MVNEKNEVKLRKNEKTESITEFDYGICIYLHIYTYCEKKNIKHMSIHGEKQKKQYMSDL